MNVCLPVLAFLSLSGPEMFFIMFLCLLFFGPKKLPSLAKAMGQSVKEFKKAASEVEDNFNSAMKEEERKEQQQKQQAALPPVPPTPSPASGGPLDTTTKPGQPQQRL